MIDGVLKEAGGHCVEQLAQDENDVLRGLLALRAKAAKALPNHAAETQHMSTQSTKSMNMQDKMNSKNTVNGRLFFLDLAGGGPTTEIRPVATRSIARRSMLQRGNDRRPRFFSPT